MAEEFGAQDAVTTLAATDLFAIRTTAGLTRRITAANVANNMAFGIFFCEISTSNYNASPPLEWYKISNGSTNAISDWVATTAYTLGEFVKPTTANGYIYQCVTADTSDAAEPTWGTTIGGDTNDASVVWRCYGLNIITMETDLTASLTAGMAIKLIDGSGTKHAQIYSISATKMVLAGAPLLSNSAITNLYYNPRGVMDPQLIVVSGAYGDGIDATLLASDMNQYKSWNAGNAYLVNFRARHKTDAGTTQPTVNVNLNGNAACAAAGRNGIQPLNANWIDCGMVPDASAVANNALVATINETNYGITYHQAIEAACTVAGTGSAASDLSLELEFVLT